ncbi:hypothetical protein J7J84_07700 [bacterium]|nr:hypothetical protein [bacterium]
MRFGIGILLLALLCLVGQPVVAATYLDTIYLPEGVSAADMISVDGGNDLIAGLDCDDYSIGRIDGQTDQIEWGAVLGTTIGLESPKPPRQICLSSDGSAVYAIDYERFLLKAFSVANGTELFDYEFDDHPSFIIAGNVSGHGVFGVICESSAYYFDSSSYSLLQTVQLPGTGTEMCAFDQGTDTVFIPLFEHDVLVSHQLSWDSSLSVTSSSISTGSKPVACIPLQASSNCAVVCTGDGTVRMHDKTTLAVQAIYAGLQNVSDAYLHDGKLVIISYHTPGVEGYQGDIMVLDPVTGNSVGSVQSGRYLFSLSYSGIPGFTHGIDRGICDGEQILPGALLTINISTGNVVDAYNLSGPCLFSCYSAVSGKLFVSDPSVYQILVFQAP